MTRIAIVDKDKCQHKKCSKECYRFCPRVRTGDKTIHFGEDGTQKPTIIESLCSGCSICVKKCPYDAIIIINLPEDFEAEVSHRYGVNSFKLHKLPMPKPKSVLGLVGQNGSGKTTSLNILSGELIPNLGNWEKPDLSSMYFIL